LNSTSSQPSGSDPLSILRGSPSLGSLDESILREIAAKIEPERLSAEDTLFRQDDAADAIYMVLRGELEAVRHDDSGAELVLSRMGVGQVVGEIQVLTGGNRTATIRAVRDTELARWSKETTHDLGTRHPEILKHLAAGIRERLRRDQLVGILPRLFGHVDNTVISDVEDTIEWVFLPRGQRLFAQSEPADCLYLTVSGRLSVVIDDDNAAPRIIGEIAPGEPVGEMAVFTGKPRSASVYAIRDSELAKVSRDNFEAIVQRHPRLLTAVTRNLIQRLQEHSGPVSQKIIRSIALVPLSRGVPLSEFAERLVAALSTAEPTTHLCAARLDAQLAMEGAAQLPDDSPYDIRIRAWLSQLEANHRFVIYEADGELSRWTRRCVRHADLVLLVARASDDVEPGEIETQFLDRENRLTAARRRLVLLHPDGSNLPTGTIRWLAGREIEMHHHVRWDSDEDFARLGRFLRGRAIGLALGGGGARGMAHIGVIRALNESGVPIDFVGGTSAGGVVATQYAMGMDSEAMQVANREAFLKHKPFRDFTIPIVSFFGAGRMDRLAQGIYGGARLEDLWLNSFCVSCNLSTSETVVHRTGMVWKAVRATSALPGIVVPMVQDGKLLVDGGIVDNLPGQIMKDFAGGPVIVVDVSPEGDLAVEHKEIPPARKILWSWIAPHRTQIEVPTIADLIVRTAIISSVKRREEARQQAILFLRPPVDGFKLLGFNEFDNIVDAGYRYARDVLAGWNTRDDYVDGAPGAEASIT
jgi:NTE family protein/lysophospholipid hydrolase